MATHFGHVDLNPAKCANLTVQLLPALKKLYVFTVTAVFIGAAPVPQLDADSTVKYLEHKFGFMNSDPPNLDELVTTLNNLTRSPVKPHQKLILL